MTSVESEIISLSAAELSGLVRSGEVSAVEVVETFLQRIEEHADGNAFITPCPDYALKQAAKNPSGPLAGLPLAVKDTFDTAGIRTTYGSEIFREHVPDITAKAVALLEAAGAILVGKNNQHEFAWGTTSQNPHWGFVQNPVMPGRVAGGSSGGTAAALADNLCTIGLGTDTGGSVRIPAACCEIVGFKPPFDVVPTAGAFPLAPTLDTVGPMARSVADCALMYKVLSGRPEPRPNLKGVRIGVLAPTGTEEELAELGAIVGDYTLPTPVADLAPVFLAECAITHHSWYPSRRAEYGPDAQAKWDAAQKVTAVEYHRGLHAMEEYRARMRQDLPVDLLVSPTIATEPPPIDCWEPDVRGAMGKYTRTYNFLGWPAIAIGNLQIAGPDDMTVLSAGLAWEQAQQATNN